MHKYIDTNLLFQFDKSIDVEDITTDLMENYKITNVYFERPNDDDYAYYLAEVLKDDIDMERANYKAYIEPGMNARMLMELRKSAILPLVEEDWYFYKEHSKCETPEQVIQHRIKYLKSQNSDYDDADWQYYAVCRWFLRNKSNGLYFNMEYCFADADMTKYQSVEASRLEFLQHIGVHYRRE